MYSCNIGLRMGRVDSRTVLPQVLDLIAGGVIRSAQDRHQRLLGGAPSVGFVYESQGCGHQVRSRSKPRDQPRAVCREVWSRRNHGSDTPVGHLITAPDQFEAIAALVRQSTGLWCGSTRPDATS
jgi:hypothetical protein